MFQAGIVGVRTRIVMDRGKKFKKYFKVNSKTGLLTIKKNSKMKKGTYKVMVKVRALGNKNYVASAFEKVTYKIKVK